jgi:hypothetical protein
MFRPTKACKHRTVDRWIVSGLLLALLLYGYSGAVLQILGPAHMHPSGGGTAASASASAGTQAPALQEATQDAAWLARARQWLRPLRDWRDSLHARSHAAGLVTHQQQHQHEHQHNAFERHHHGTDDATVVALDGGAAASDALADGVSAASAGSASLPLGLGASLVLPEPTASGCRWPPPAATAWVNALAKQPERPPRA